MLIAFFLLATAAVVAFGWLSARDIPPGSARVATSLRAKASSEWDHLKALVGSRRAAP